MQISPYLNFDGQCGEAFRFYEQVLGGKIDMMMTMGESPMAGEVPPETHDRVMHVSMTVGGQMLMGSDSMPDQYQKPQGLFVSIHYDTAEEGGRIFNALAENGTVIMPFEKTFWAEGFGMLVDRFGTPWMVNAGQSS
jgi:PhnB protein